MSKKLFGFDLLAEQAATWARESVHSHRKWAEGDSEIEKLMITALSAILDVRPFLFMSLRVRRRPNDLDAIKAEIDKERELAFIVEPQAQMEWGRVDFLLHVPDWNDERGRAWSQVVIECDGHDFHERTKAQASHDRTRDRAAALAGIPTLRFTGSELWRDPMGCAAQVIKLIEGL